MDNSSPCKDDDYAIIRYFEPRFVAATRVINKKLFNDPQIALKLPEEQTNILVATLNDYVWQEQIDHRDVKYPFDWWQALKERWLPRWALKRWPIKYQEITLKVQRYYPEWKDPKLGKYNTVVDLEKSWWDDPYGN